MNKTVEQLQQEAKEAQTKLEKALEANRAAEQAAKEAQEQQKRQEEKKQEAAKRLPIIQALVKALNEVGIAAEVRPGIIGSEATGFDAHLPHVKFPADHPWNARIEIKEMQRGGYFHSRGTGRLYMTVGDFGNITKYPQKADGSFSYDKIAKTVADLVKTATDKAQRQQKEDTLLKTAEQLTVEVRKSVHKTHEYSIQASQYVRGFGNRHSHGYTTLPEKGKVLFTVGTLQVTPSQAKELSDFLVKMFPAK